MPLVGAGGEDWGEGKTYQNNPLVQIILLTQTSTIRTSSIRSTRNPTTLIIQTIEINPRTMAIPVPVTIPQRLPQIAIL